MMDKLKPMSDSAFGLMVLAMSLDPFHSPIKKLNKFQRLFSDMKGQTVSKMSPGNFTGLTVVDYACGPGRYTIPVARMTGPTGKVFAIDIQHLAVDIVKREAARNGLPNVEAILVDSFRTPLPDASVDIVLLIDAIWPIKDRLSLLREIHRLLKTTGCLFMDSSHMSARKAEAIVQESGLFKLLIIDGKEMIWAKR